jgi:hypothetical protein
MRYEWDERKNRSNQRKHGGISFELAALVFDDERLLIQLDRVDSAGEQRWHAIGAVSVDPGTEDYLVVTHVYRRESESNRSRMAPMEGEDGEEIIRIISARRADKNEFRRYQKQKVD